MPVSESVDEDDEHDSKDTVLQKYFLQEWKLVKSLLDDIVSNQKVSDLSSVHKIRSIVLLSASSPTFVVVSFCNFYYNIFYADG
jgi:hypothetical protein